MEQFENVSLELIASHGQGEDFSGQGSILV